MKFKRSSNKNWTHIISIVVVSSLLTLFLHISGFAAGYEDQKSLLLLGNENLIPVIYNDNGEAKGVVVDIAKAIGDRLGIDVKVLAMDWEEAQTMVLNGEADGLLQINPSTERAKIYDFSEPLLKSEFSIFVKADNIIIKGIEDLRGKNVGVEAGGYMIYLLQGYEEIHIEILDDWNSSFENLANGKLDAIVADRWHGEYALAKNSVKDIRVIENPIETQYSRIAVRKGDADTLALINSGLKEVTEDGTIGKIMEQWKGKRVVYITKNDYRIILQTAIVFLLVVSLSAIYLFIKYRSLSKKLEVKVRQRTEELRRANDLLKVSNDELERLSMRDCLTPLDNRRSFNIEYKKAWDLSVRNGTPLALIAIDIDHFKVFNDTYGHLVGDQVLIRVAEVIKESIYRPGDIVARYGGEEFAVMLMNTTRDDAVTVAERIRKGIEELRLDDEKVESFITISLGVVSVVPTDKMAPDELISMADKALYRAKDNGRNIVETWG